MKQTSCSRNKKDKAIGNRKTRAGEQQVINILRTTKDQEAFYFYETIDKPTGEVARNLKELLDKVKTIKTESIVFHLHRKDFQNWIQKILCDTELAERVDEISTSKDNEIRTNISKILEERLTEL